MNSRWPPKIHQLIEQHIFINMVISYQISKTYFVCLNIFKNETINFTFAFQFHLRLAVHECQL